MAEATRVPSDATRALLRQAAETGTVVLPAVTRFSETARRAREWFDREVEPLNLPMGAYEALVRRSGLADVLDLTQRMEAALFAVVGE